MRTICETPAPLINGLLKRPLKTKKTNIRKIHAESLKKEYTQKVGLALCSFDLILPTKPFARRHTICLQRVITLRFSLSLNEIDHLKFRLIGCSTFQDECRASTVLGRSLHSEKNQNFVTSQPCVHIRCIRNRKCDTFWSGTFDSEGKFRDMKTGHVEIVS